MYLNTIERLISELNGRYEGYGRRVLRSQWRQEVRLYALRDAFRNVFLNSKHFVGGLFIYTRPEQAAIPHVDESRGNAKTIAVVTRGRMQSRLLAPAWRRMATRRGPRAAA